MLRMQREADRIFSRLGTQAGAQGEEPWMPRIDIKQQGDDMQIRAELPGMKPEDVDIDVTNGVLTIKGESKKEEEREDEGWLVRESRQGSFLRSVALPEGVDPNSIKADYHDGVLEMRVPGAFKQVQPQSTKISVGTGQPAGAMTSGSGTQGQQKEEPRMAEKGRHKDEPGMGKWEESESSQLPSEGDRETIEADMASKK
jgi:HSP20 family protein